MTRPLGVSIIIVNYNNERYLPVAIDSALAQDHALCEVIVVDDCSTDKSRSVIRGYRHRIRSRFQEVNRGQIAASIAGWRLVRYSIVVFLDSDDVLLPHAAAAYAGIWTETTVKAQAQISSVSTNRDVSSAILPQNTLQVWTR